MMFSLPPPSVRLSVISCSIAHIISATKTHCQPYIRLFLELYQSRQMQKQNMFAAKIYIQKLECSSTKNMIVLYLTIYTCQIRFSLSGETKDKTLLLCLYRPHDCLRRHSLIPYHQPQKVQCPSFLRWASVRNHKKTCTFYVTS